MGYIERSLAANEQLIYRAHFPWLYRLAAWGSLLAAVLVAFLSVQRVGAPIAFAIAAAGAVVFLAVMIPIWSQQIAVTNQRLIYRRGLVGRSTEELQLRAVEEVQLEQGILGRLLGFGRVTVAGTGVEDVRLPVLGAPVRLRQMMQEAISQSGLSWQTPGEVDLARSAAQSSAGVR
jgi:membrane protein YdbS with pleckstrin-like domain